MNATLFRADGTTAQIDIDQVDWPKPPGVIVFEGRTFVLMDPFAEYGPSYPCSYSEASVLFHSRMGI
jgi:hypothetical protein